MRTSPRRSHTPIHIFTVEGPNGRRRIIIPGGYCDVRYPQRLRAGESIVAGSKTWRSSFVYLDHPSDSQKDYQRS